MTEMTDVDITSPAFKADPYPFFAQLRAQAPVYRTRLPDKRPAWLLTRYDDVAAALRDERLVKDYTRVMSKEQLAKVPWLPEFVKPLQRNMIKVDAPDHTRLRGLVHKAFTPGRVEEMRARVQQISDDLLDAAERRGRMDLIHDFALPLPVTVIADILGIPQADQHRFRGWTQVIVSATASSIVGQLLIIPTMLAFLRYIRKLIRRRRADLRDDLISALIEAEEAGDKLNEDELAAMIFLLLVAGHETTVNLIGNGMLALLEHRDQLERLRNEPALIKTAVEELLRYASPGELADERFAREDIML